MEYTKLLGKVTLTCDGLHDSSKEYERLSLVYDTEYRSFISIKEVPVNISLTNVSYWQPISVITADGEDLEVNSDLRLKFADKEYNPGKHSGLGRKILRKRIVNNKNVLKQTDFDSSDTIYVIQYDFDLLGNSITIPNNSTLLFEGGKLLNGTVNLTDTMLLPQGLDVYENIPGIVKGKYKEGQIYFDSVKNSLIAVTSTNEIDLTTPNVVNQYTRYNWIKYSATLYGDLMTDTPLPNTQYIGIASNKDTAEPSNSPLDYLWAKIKGNDGERGERGPVGPKGIPGDKGENGKPGADGNDGIGIKPNWSTFVFKQAELEPATPTFTNPTPGSSGINGWVDGPSAVGKWWMSKGNVDGRSNMVVLPWSKPVQCTAEDGHTNSYVDFKYAKTDNYTVPPSLDKADRNPSGWYDTPQTLSAKEYMWLTNALIDENDNLVYDWSDPVRITGELGPIGEPGESIPGTAYNTVFAFTSSIDQPEKPIGGSWDYLTNVVTFPEKWSGNDETLTPPIWSSNKTFTSDPNILGEWSVPLKITGSDGAPGKDGISDEFIYILTKNGEMGNAPNTPVSVNEDDSVPDLWTDSPKGVSATMKAEWVCTRSKKEGLWSKWSKPALWSMYGENGQDGDGVQYIFYRTATNAMPVNPTPDNMDTDRYQEKGDFENVEYIPTSPVVWTDNPQGVTKEIPYEWVCQRKYRNGRWKSYLGPSLWAKYGKDGIDGLGGIIVDLDNEVQQVACDSQGNVLSGLPLYADLNMYYGTTELDLTDIVITPSPGVTATADRKTGIVTVTEITRDAPINMKINITGVCLFNNEVLERTVTLNINKVQPGENGEDAVLYQLVPDVGVIKVDKLGVPEVTGLGCKVKRTLGKTTSILTILPEGFFINSCIDDGDEIGYTLGTEISTKNIDSKLQFLLYDKTINNLVDKESIYKVKDGEDGETGFSSIVADIDNEILSVACDANGKVLSGVPVTATFSMYYGTTKLVMDTFSVDAAASNVTGVTYSTNVGTGIITVTDITQAADDVINITLVGLATFNTAYYSRKSVLTINKVKAGTDGQTPIIYSLSLSTTQIKLNKLGANSPNSVTARILKTVGGTPTNVGLPTGYTLTFSFDSFSPSSIAPGDSISTAQIKEKLIFELKNQGGVTLDRETIYVVSDGTDGEDGADGETPNWNTYIYKESALEPDRPTSSDIIPSGWEDVPKSIGLWWLCIGLVNGLTKKVTVWSKVLPVNGRDGQALDGARTEFRFAVNSNATTPPSLLASVREPLGWTVATPAIAKGQYLWMTHADVNANGTLKSNWNEARRISGEDGSPGTPGVSYYTWIKYSDNNPSSDSQIYDIPNQYTKYIGTRYNNLKPEETDPNSAHYNQYTWIKWVGDDGADGLTGEAGLLGRIVYPMGTYDENVTYTATNKQAPFVLLTRDQLYYVMVQSVSWLGTSKGMDPKEDAETNGNSAVWMLMEKYSAVYTNLIIADNGKLGQFVFNKGYMFSLYGKNKFGQPTSNYQDFKKEGLPFKWTDSTIWETKGITGSVESDKIVITSQYTDTSSVIRTNNDTIDRDNELPKHTIKIQGITEYDVYGEISSVYKVRIRYNVTSAVLALYINIVEDGIYEIPLCHYLTYEMSKLGVPKLDIPFVIELDSTEFFPNYSIDGNTGIATLVDAIVSSDKQYSSKDIYKYDDNFANINCLYTSVRKTSLKSIYNSDKNMVEYGFINLSNFSGGLFLEVDADGYLGVFVLNGSYYFGILLERMFSHVKVMKVDLMLDILKLNSNGEIQYIKAKSVLLVTGGLFTAGVRTINGISVPILIASRL